MKYLFLAVLFWQGCTLPNGDLVFIDGQAICYTGQTIDGPYLECWRER